jgi:hypothetical protein
MSTAWRSFFLCVVSILRVLCVEILRVKTKVKGFNTEDAETSEGAEKSRLNFEFSGEAKLFPPLGVENPSD